MTVLPCRSPTADSTSACNSPLCGLCCNLKTKTKGSRTSPQCPGTGRLRVRASNPKESRTTRSPRRKRPQRACYRFGNECHTPDLTSNLRDIWAMDPIIGGRVLGWRRDIGINRRTLSRPAPFEKQKKSPSAATPTGPVDAL